MANQMQTFVRLKTAKQFQVCICSNALYFVVFYSHILFPPYSPIVDLAAETGDQLNFKVWVPRDATRMNVFIDSFSGDADLYIRAHALPTKKLYDYRPYWKGSIEYVRTEIAQTGWFYIMIYAARS